MNIMNTGFLNMKKIWLTLVAVICFAATLMAETVSPATARQVAAQFLKAQGATLTDDGANTHRSKIAAAHDKAPAYYIFNADAAQGYVVVSGDDCVGDNLVLGYTAQGSFNADNVPDNLQWWLDATAEGIARLSVQGSKAAKVATHDDIAPMVTARWDQHEPYNESCPKVSGELPPTGCMATALAQVMHYHRWPQAATGKLPAYKMVSGATVSALPSTKFDWDNMLDDYSNGYTDEQGAAVSKLMRYCGQLLQMDYALGGSSANVYDLNLLVNSFGYDPGVSYANAEGYTVSGWDALLYNELREGRPLAYGGSSTGGAHAFVIDGYQVQDGEGYYHVNWGWSGNDNGFYKISLLNPGGSGSGGSTTKDGYSRWQMALIGLQPRRDPSEKFYRYLHAWIWNGQTDGDSETWMVNPSNRDATFELALVGRKNDGTPDYSDVRTDEVINVPGFTNVSLETGVNIKGFFTVVFSENLCRYIFSGLAPGHHTYMFINRECVDGAPWKPVFGPNNYVEVVIDSKGQLEQVIQHPNPQLSLSPDELEVEGIKQSGISQTVYATIHNASANDYIGSVNINMYEVKDGVLKGPVVKTKTGLLIEGGGTSQVFTNVMAPAAGDYVLLLTHCNTNADGAALKDIEKLPYYLAHKGVSFDELEFTCTSLMYGESTTDDGDPLYYVDVVLDNGTPLDYDAVLVFKFYKCNESGEYGQEDFFGSRYIPIIVPSKTSQPFTMLIPPLEPGNYVVELEIANDFYSIDVDDYFVFSKMLLPVTGTGIRGVESEGLSDVWYDLSGRRLNKKPSKRGIYILKGQKVLVE